MEVEEDSELEVEDAEGFTDNEADFAAPKLHTISNLPGRYIGN